MKDKKMILTIVAAFFIGFGLACLGIQSIIDSDTNIGSDVVVVENKNQLCSGFETAIAYNKDYVAYPCNIEGYKYEFVSVDTGHEYIGDNSSHMIQRKEIDGTPTLNRQWMDWKSNDRTIPYYTEITKKAGN